MANTSIDTEPVGRSRVTAADVAITLTCWLWFTAGYILFFSWRYLFAAIFSTDREAAFQRLNCRFYRSFFRLLQAAAPKQHIEIAPEVAAIRSGVVVCNHLSYLDPLLLISVYEKHKTIVKSRFFSVPIFGWVVRKSGYLPDQAEGARGRLMVEQMENLTAFFEESGNLFVFPEGTRSRDGRVGPLRQGALKIARLAGVPVYVVRITNTDKLFTPGKFFFNTRRANTMTLRLVERIGADELAERGGDRHILHERLRQAYESPCS